MLTVHDTDQLEESIAALGPVHADLALRLRAARMPDDLLLEQANDGNTTGTLGGVRLASRREPGAEGERLAARIDLLENATVVVFGFGLGHHVRALAARMKGMGLIIVVEPNEDLLRTALSSGCHASWLRSNRVVFITDGDDPATLSRRLQGADALLCQGLCFLDHPASMRRLGNTVLSFRRHMADHMLTARTTLVTSLLRSIETVRNITLNLPWHCGGPGISDLAGVAVGAPAVLVSAGPSLHRNIRQLAAPGVRERCVIIAAQTTLKPLLNEGVRPHFVTALDYHEISRRFYEGLNEDDLEGVTLIADPKANPAILDSFRGRVRCFDIPFLRQLLGTDHPEFGSLPAGATVAHLSLYLAKYLGCNPIAMIGQDLGFPDALYYAPGTAIHEVWAPELNPFNTIANMEWQRIARHRQHLSRREDIHGRMIHTDLQMLAYLQQFERDFLACREAGIRVIDATEGGVVKRHAEIMPLAEVLETFATKPIPPLPSPPAPDARLKQRAARRIRGVDDAITQIKASAQRTVVLLRAMRDAERERQRLEIYRKIETERKTVDERMDAFTLLNHMNQLGTFRRARADRRIELQRDTMTQRELENAQIDRDIDNVTWIEEAATEMSAQLRTGRARLEGRTVTMRPKPAAPRDIDGPVSTRVHVAAMIPVDPRTGGIGEPGTFTDPMRPLAGRPVLHRTLAALDRVGGLDSIVLLVPDDLNTDAMLAGLSLRLPLIVERCGASPFGTEYRAVRSARTLAASSWRGGVAGMSVFDEALCPAAMLAAMERHDLTAAMVVGPDWVFLRSSGPGSCQEVIARHREHPQLHRLVFTQACPGMSGCVINRSLMAQLAERSRLGTVGALLVHQPSVPQVDPVHRDANVPVEYALRTVLLRAIPDAPARHAAAERVLAAADRSEIDLKEADSLVASLQRAEAECRGDLPAPHLLLEITQRRAVPGSAPGDASSNTPRSVASEADMEPSLVAKLCAWCARSGEGTVTFGGAGDPLLHPEYGAIVEAATASGIRTIHVRTDLCDDASLTRLVSHPPDIVSVNIRADTPETWTKLGGTGELSDLFRRLERLVHEREHLSGPPGFGAIARPWIVPRLERRIENVQEIETFFDRWQHLLGTAVIEAAEGGTGSAERADGLVEAVTPRAVCDQTLQSRLFVRADGTIPLSESGPRGAEIIGHATTEDLTELWRRLSTARAACADELRMIHP